MPSTRIKIRHAPIPFTIRTGCALITCLIAWIAGCQQSSQTTAGAYETVAGESLHNTEAARVHNLAGIKAVEADDTEKAEKSFKKALEADIMFGPAHNNLGKVYYQRGLYYKAAWEYQYAIKLMPNHPEPKYNLGLVYESVGKLNEAVDLYSEARDLEPDNPILIGNIARARIKRGDGGEEVRDLLTELLLRETRPEWIDWARERLSLIPQTRDTP